MKRVLCIMLLLLSASLLIAWQAPAESLVNGLTPDQPASYLDIGERLAAKAGSDEQLRLAQQVLTLGIGLNFSEGDRAKASSCCIALADTLSNDPESQQALWDLALTLDPERLSAWAEHRAGEGTAASNATAAECIRLARNASVDEADDLLRQRSVREAIEHACRALGLDSTTILSELTLMLQSPTRDPCRGQVFESVVEDGKSSRVICDAHQYPIATAPNPTLLTQLLSIEIFCLQAQGGVSEWGGVVAMGLDGPLRDPGVLALYQRFGVDPQRPYRNNGRWVSQP